MRAYKCLKQQVFEKDNYKIVPIRDEDKYEIMRWRNEQIYHLRQKKPLTKEKQERYFENVVSKLFDEEQPTQILFSYLENNICIGYGGLVHINWIDKNAEISFIIETKLERDYFYNHWKKYLKLIEQVAFGDLDLHKIFTYAFDLRLNLYEVLESSDYFLEARLKEHSFFEGKFIDVIIHSKLNNIINLRRAKPDDVDIYYNWVNDGEVREQSYNSSHVIYENHVIWFNNKIFDKNCLMLIGESHGIPIGQVRFENNDETSTSIIGVSIGEKFRGKSISSRLLQQASEYFLEIFTEFTIEAYIKESNQKSIKSFIKAGFNFSKKVIYQGVDSVLYIKNK
jgi:RimJ/RimL family protein N-acetyltransferase